MATSTGNWRSSSALLHTAESRLTAGVAWATPVRPDELGHSLEAYKRVLPSLRGLRLCYRFGQGPDVHVTKLPTELEQAVEMLIITSGRHALRGSRWFNKFRHFESRCSPVEHGDVYDHLSDEISDYISLCDHCVDYELALCEKRCRADGSDLCYTCTQKIDPQNCMETCRAELETEMNSVFQDWAMYDDCPPPNDDCEQWEDWINQSDGGHFVQYDKILQEEFGLEAFFCPARIALEDKDVWPRHRAHQFHVMEELCTTLCALTLSGVFAPKKTCMSTELENEFGNSYHHVNLMLPLGQLLLHDRAKISKLFARAMRILGLQPYVHPTQANKFLNMPLLNAGNTDGDAVDPEYPALMLIAKNLTIAEAVQNR